MHDSVADDVVGNEAAAQVAASTEGQDRWYKLMPVLTLVLGLAAIGAYYVPAYPDLGLPLGMLLIACWLCLLARSLYMTRAVQRSQPGPASWSYFAPMSQKTRTFTDLLLPTSMTMVLFSGVQMIFVTLSHDYTADLSFAFSVAGFLCIGFATLLSAPAVRDTAFVRWLAKPVTGLIFSVGIFVLVIGLSLFITFEGPRYLTVGPAASQSQLFAFARTQAARIDKAAVLSSVRAGIMYKAPGPYSPDKTPMSVNFSFLGPTSGYIDVEVLDTDPPRLQRISNSEYDLDIPPVEQVSLLKAVEADLKIGPRDVYRLTEPEAQRVAQRKGITLQLSMNAYLGCKCKEQYGVPLTWEVRYFASVFETELRSIVDASSGKVLQSNEGQDGREITSAPTVMP
jgi:hypothetical protein